MSDTPGSLSESGSGLQLCAEGRCLCSTFPVPYEP